MMILNVGLLLVDHIHFQYNGMLLGILFLSFDAANRGHYITTTIYFCILVLMKHLFVFLVPAFGFFLLRSYCGWEGFCVRTGAELSSSDSTYESFSATSKAKVVITANVPSNIPKDSQQQHVQSVHNDVHHKNKKKKNKQQQQQQQQQQQHAIQLNKNKIILQNDNVDTELEKRNCKQGSVIVFLYRLWILVMIAAMALVIAFGPFIIRFPAYNGDEGYLTYLKNLITITRKNDITGESAVLQGIRYSGLSLDSDYLHQRMNVEDGHTNISAESDFIDFSQLNQIFTRLFPFGRGLVHAFWAPNVWALYCGIDKAGSLFIKKSHLFGPIFLRTFRKVQGTFSNKYSYLSSACVKVTQLVSEQLSAIDRMYSSNYNGSGNGSGRGGVERVVGGVSEHVQSAYNRMRRTAVTLLNTVATSDTFEIMKRSTVAYTVSKLQYSDEQSRRLVSSSSGLTGDFRLFLLPDISAICALSFTLFSMIPALFVLVTARKKNIQIKKLTVIDNEKMNDIKISKINCEESVKMNMKNNVDSNKSIEAQISSSVLIHSVLFTSLCSFMLGYHVHEKAILVPVVCASSLAFTSSRHAVLFLKLSAIGIFSLFPLLTGIDELMIKCKYAGVLCVLCCGVS